RVERVGAVGGAGRENGLVGGDRLGNFDLKRVVPGERVAAGGADDQVPLPGVVGRGAELVHLGVGGVPGRRVPPGRRDEGPALAVAFLRGGRVGEPGARRSADHLARGGEVVLEGG